MAISGITVSNVTPTLSLPDPNDHDVVQVAYGPHTFNIHVHEIVSAMVLGNLNKEWLILQFLTALFNAGVDPRTATLSQMNTAIQNAAPYKVVN